MGISEEVIEDFPSREEALAAWKRVQMSCSDIGFGCGKMTITIKN